ncbi:hypothetical protein D915_001247 [Fasciola hepatica]|uniref:Uncharacterized protein n=1 Tax=Fasciola hepatica TaxID=6192 RepID=A0A4E0S2R0_FASHE|nr:hypothetical protein D915_001247 [Fasciola hepatica]
MGKSNIRRLRAHWAKAIPDRPLALQLIKVRPFIYTACRLRQVTSDLIEQAEEPLAILTVTEPTNSPRQPQSSQQLTQLPLTKEAVLDGQSDPVDISLLSTLSEWADFVPAAIESSGSKHKENVETHQLNAVCEMVDLTQPNLAQSGLPKRVNSSDGKDAPSNLVCMVASTPKKESFTSQQPHELSSTPSIADRTRSFLRFPIDLIRNLVNRFAVRYEPLANPTPLDHPVELLEGPSALKRRKQTEDSSSTPEVVLRSLCYRLRKSYASSMLQKNRTGLRTTQHPGTGTSRPSLCAALIDSFMHDQVPFVDTTVDSIRDVCPETPELQSAPARITVKRKVNHSETNGINVLTEVVKEIAALNAITLSPSIEEKLRVIEETV